MRKRGLASPKKTIALIERPFVAIRLARHRVSFINIEGRNV